MKSLALMFAEIGNSSFSSPPVFNWLNQEKKAKKYFQHFLSFGPKVSGMHGNPCMKITLVFSEPFLPLWVSLWPEVTLTCPGNPQSNTLQWWKANPDICLPPYCLTLCSSGLSSSVTASDHPHLPPYPKYGLCGLHNTPQVIWHSSNNTPLLLPLAFTLDSKLLQGRGWRSFSASHMAATQWIVMIQKSSNWDSKFRPSYLLRC